MAVGRAARRIEREPRFVEVFGADGAPRALDLLEIVEFAWHDCYQEVTPPDGVIDDMLVFSDGRLDRFVDAARLAVTDWRDLRVAADQRRGGT